MPAAKGRTGGKVVVATSWFPLSLDFGRSSSTDHNITGPMVDYFLRSGPDGVIDATNKNGVLKSWDISADGKVMTWTLKPGIFWHDGVEMTSDDIKFTWERDGVPATDKYPATGMQVGLTRTNLDHIDIVDKYTAKIYMKNPDPSSLLAFSNTEGDMEIIPSHHYKAIDPSLWIDHPLGSGPFKFVGWVPQQYIDFTANLNYWNTDRIPGYDSLRIELVPEPATRVALLKAGEADLVSLVASDATALKAGGYGLEGPQYGGWVAGFMRGSYQSTNWGNNLLFRKAMVTGIDRANIVKQIFPPEVGVPMAGTGPFTQAAVGYDPTLPIYPYDPTLAKQYLQQSGYNGDKCIVYGATTHTPLQPEQNDMSEAIAAYMQKIGINTEYKILDTASRTNLQGALWPYWTVNKGNGNCIVETQVFYNRNSVIANMRAILISPPAGGTTGAYWDLAYMDKLYLQVQNTADPVARAQIFKDLNNKMYGEYWTIPIVNRQLTFGVGPKVQPGSWGPTYGAYIDLAWETVKLK